MKNFAKSFFILAVAIILISPLLTPAKTQALSGNDFKPGRIIDDSIFFNKDAMNVQQIQDFLNAKVPVCDRNHPGFTGSSGTVYSPPFTCLKEYNENPTTHENNIGKFNANGTPYQVPGGKNAAQLIWDVSQEYNINPQVILVTLQKETGLVTDDWAASWQYRTAMGYGCPDTAACDSNYYGFYNQISSAAWQFRRYATVPDSYNFKGGVTRYVGYNPTASCGGSNVYIENQATAGLYNYTPYQPNAAALGVMNDSTAGGSVTCGAYGNRNFFWYFNQWFGSTLARTQYDWEFVSYDVYIDQARTKKINSEIEVPESGKLYFTLKARNVGGKIWRKNEINLGTSRSNDRSSIFATSNWLNSARPATLKEDLVFYNSVGSFDFEMQAPPTTGAYNEYFSLVAEGVSWFNDPGAYFRINVTKTIPSQPATGTTILTSGQQLGIGEYRLSNEKNQQLILQKDGNVVLYYPFTSPAWHTNTSSTKATRLVMQTDGNLVLYDDLGKPLWNTQTSNNPGSRLVMQTDGNLVLYNSSGIPTWATYTFHYPDFVTYISTTLKPGILFSGQKLTSPNRIYKMIMQTDGNLVLYKNNQAIWATGTDGKKISFLAMQTDGNLVLYDDLGKPLWNTKTHGSGNGNTLTLQDDGNLVLYSQLMKPVWNTETYAK